MRYLRAVFAHDWPDVRAEDEHFKFSAVEILLIPDVLIGRDQNVEPGLFCGPEQLPVSQLGMPPHVFERTHFMLG